MKVFINWLIFVEKFKLGINLNYINEILGENFVKFYCTTNFPKSSREKKEGDIVRKMANFHLLQRLIKNEENDFKMKSTGYIYILIPYIVYLWQ